MTRQFVPFALALALGLASGAALAEGWYAGVSAGQARYDSDDAKQDLDATLASVGAGGISSSEDDTDTGYKLYVGYQLNPHFGVELGYVDLGEWSYDASFTSPAPGTARGTAEVRGVTLGLVGRVPVGERFAVLGRLGVIKPKLDVDASVQSGGLSASGSETSRNLRFNWGLGAQYDFTQTVGVRLEWERFDNLGNDDTGRGDVDLWSLGAVLRF